MKFGLSLCTLIVGFAATRSLAAEPILLKTRKIANPRQDVLEKVKRASDGYTSAVLGNEGSLYVIDVQVGTPAQTLQLQLDTGSSDFWAFADGNPYCKDGTSSSSKVESSDQISCAGVSLFDRSKSKTFSYNESVAWDFYIAYGDSTFAAGKWGKDTVKIGDISLENAYFAVATEGTAVPGLLGIGFPQLEAGAQGGIIYPTVTSEFPAYATSESQSDQVAPSNQYVNIPQQMYESGKIGAWAYSLWLDDLNATSGNILFGGVDTAKYEGSLTTLPLLSNQEMVIELTSMNLTDKDGNSIEVQKEPVAALLDSGTSEYAFPSLVEEAIARSIGYKFSNDAGGYIGLCSVADDDSVALTLNFGGKHIKVSLSQILIPVSGDTCMWYASSDNTPHDEIILGDVFLRSAYVVYDLKNKEISIAQTKFGEDSSDIKALDDSGVPGKISGAATASALSSSVNNPGIVDGWYATTLTFDSNSDYELDFPTSLYLKSSFGLFTGSAAEGAAETTATDAKSTGGSTAKSTAAKSTAESTAESTGSGSSSSSAKSTSSKSAGVRSSAPKSMAYLCGIIGALLGLVII